MWLVVLTDVRRGRGLQMRSSVVRRRSVYVSISWWRRRQSTNTISRVRSRPLLRPLHHRYKYYYYYYRTITTTVISSTTVTTTTTTTVTATSTQKAIDKHNQSCQKPTSVPSTLSQVPINTSTTNTSTTQGFQFLPLCDDCQHHILMSWAFLYKTTGKTLQFFCVLY